jgi:hypothetical protein
MSRSVSLISASENPDSRRTFVATVGGRNRFCRNKRIRHKQQAVRRESDAVASGFLVARKA